jgi:hypothetical protein
MLLRLLVTLAFVVSFDVILFDGKYTQVVEQVAVAVFQHFWTRFALTSPEKRAKSVSPQNIPSQQAGGVLVAAALPGLDHSQK